MTTDLKITLLNINGIRNKRHEVVQLLSKHNPHLLLITESKLNSFIPDSAISFTGYKIIRVDRNLSKHSAGGLLIFISNHLTHNIKSQNKIADCENISLNISLTKKKSLNLTLLYRPPNSNLNNFLLSLDKYLNLLDPTELSLIAGDFNIDVFNLPLSTSAKNYMQILSSNSFKQIVDQPTRLSPQCHSIIDHILISTAITDFSIHVFDSCCSDHQGIRSLKESCNNNSHQNHSFISYRDSKNFSKENFQADTTLHIQ